MYLLIHPEWLKGAQGFENGKELGGGYAGAPAEDNAIWHEMRLNNLSLIEVRGKKLPDKVKLFSRSLLYTNQGTIPKQAHFTCSSCGRENGTLEAVRLTAHTAPTTAYTYQCHCPQCESEGYNYGGRYFKAIDKFDVCKFIQAEHDWQHRSKHDLFEYWPKEEIPFSHETHIRRPMSEHGYTHWWKMFNPRQLLVQSQILKAIIESNENSWPLDVKEQTIGIFQQYLRNQNMFCFWDIGYDKLVPMMSNPNFHPKTLSIENNVFHKTGRGNFESNQSIAISGLEWANNPWEIVLLPETEKTKSKRVQLGDPVIPGNASYCGSSTDLSILGAEKFDLSSYN